MGMAFVETQAAEVIPPIYGQVAAIPVTTTVTVVDLCSFPRTKTTPGDRPTKNAIGAFIRITAVGGDVYYVTGNNFAQLNTIASASTPSAVNATNGTVTFSGGETDSIPNGTWKGFRAMPGNNAQAAPLGADSPCRYVALITATGTASARMYQSSR